MKEGVWSQGRLTLPPPIKVKVFATLPFILGIPGTHTFSFLGVTSASHHVSFPPNSQVLSVELSLKIQARLT